MMKFGLILAASAFALVACGNVETTATTTPDDVAEETAATPAPDELTIANEPQLAPDPVAYYDETVWDIAQSWPGEYPQGFSITQDGVTLKARAEMTPYSPQNIDCPVPKMATYQLWNGPRNEADALEWRSATQTFPITVSEAVTLDAEGETGPVKVDLAAGDTVTYLRYYGEGFMAIRHDGNEYGIDGWSLQQASDMETAGAETADVDEWVQMPCADGQRGWVLYREAVEADGVVPTPITGYGESADLTEETLQQALDEVAAQAEWERMEAEDAAETSD